eukprot:TRINITY_DN11459_c0_g1_i6.p1 TRINITY_DN11459_c0_g1~~TRINITY_DN11459_c0_g1_i6.p1  ORF type:complete len:334 (-),score=47.86 TRINITY_DN11459_c0_g1_i6:40-1041(-)
MGGSDSEKLAASPVKRRKVDENLASENRSTQLTLAEENLAVELLACNESIAPHCFPALFPAVSAKTLPSYSPETINHIISTESSYGTNPFYLETQHRDITCKMVLILLDWVAEVCADFRFHRETFHLALAYVHRYLSLTDSLPVVRLQLLGLAAITTASKLNEVRVPRFVDVAKCAADCYTVAQIKEMELAVAASLAWHLVPPTTFFWANMYAEQWDEFSEGSEFGEMKFKEPSEDSYKRYRQLMQIIDYISMEVEHLQYNQRVLAGSAIYIVLSMCLHSVEKILLIFTKGSKFIIEPNSFNKAFESFALLSLHFSLEAVSYTHLTLPTICSV